MKQITLALLLLIAYLPLNAQQMIVDSISTTKVWRDKNGDNELIVSVSAACNSYSDITVPDGHPSIIKATLKNDNHNLDIQYSLEDYMLVMLNFYDEGIWFHNIDGMQAVFIPFFYCAMLDSEMKLSYIILYDNQKFLYHFNYLWQEGTEGIKLVESDLDKKLDLMPEKVKNIFKEYLIQNYTTTDDIVPSHETFKNSKFQTKTKIDVSTDYRANYPYILLNKIDRELREKEYHKAFEYLMRFKKLYIDFVIGEVDLNYIVKIEKTEKMLDKAKELTDQNRFKDAYMIYIHILNE